MTSLDIFYQIMSSIPVLQVAAWAGIPLTIILIVLFCLKSHRDERGWKIIGKASIVSFICLIILANGIAKWGGALARYNYDIGATHYVIGYTFWGNTIQLIYDIVLLVEIIAILILRKTE